MSSFSNRPIRKRAYHRALKRGELWAVMIYQQKKMMAQMLNYYRGPVYDQLNEDLNIVSLSDQLKERP